MRAAIALLLLTACGPRAVLGLHERGGRGAGASGADHAETPTAITGGDLLVDSSVGPIAYGEPVSGVVLSRLPAPHRFTVATAFTPANVEAARALVGHRDPRAPLAFALDTAAALSGATLPAFTTGAELVPWAQERGAFAPIVAGARAALAPGDLAVFDRVVGGEPASLVAVVLGVDDRGVADLLYLGRGVVRRGYVDPARPTLARDREGRVVNSYLRHGAEHPPAGTRYLAGELVTGRVRLR